MLNNPILNNMSSVFWGNNVEPLVQAKDQLDRAEVFDPSEVVARLGADIPLLLEYDWAKQYAYTQPHENSILSGWDPKQGLWFVHGDPDSNPTIGGGLMIAGSNGNWIREVFSRSDSSELRDIANDWSGLLGGTRGITPEENFLGMSAILNKKRLILQQQIPEWDLLSVSDQKVLVDGAYWGQFSSGSLNSVRGSPKTMDLLRRGLAARSPELLRAAAAEAIRSPAYVNNLNRPRFHAYQKMLFDLADRFEQGLGFRDREEGPILDTHTIEKGDTLWGVSRDTGIPVYKLQNMNPELDPGNLPIGGEIRLIPQDRSS